MSHTLDRLAFFTRKTELFANGHGVTNDDDRGWEEAYRSRWRHDKIVRSTHGVNCSWYLYSANRVKYPLVRSRLLKLWREARATQAPVAAWASIQNDPEK